MLGNVSMSIYCFEPDLATTPQLWRYDRKAMISDPCQNILLNWGLSAYTSNYNVYKIPQHPFLYQEECEKRYYVFSYIFVFSWLQCLSAGGIRSYSCRLSYQNVLPLNTAGERESLDLCKGHQIELSYPYENRLHEWQTNLEDLILHLFYAMSYMYMSYCQIWAKLENQGIWE